MKHLHALTALLTGDDPPTQVRLFAAGANDTEKGVFLFTEESATAVLAAAERWGNEYSFDYEHQALQHPPVEAPAAGWFTLEVRRTTAGPELWATNIRWTPRALERLRAKEYRYTSPAFLTDESGTILELINVAITNLPATRALPALVAAHHRPFTGAAGAQEGDRMKTLMRTLGLNPDASEDAALEAIRTLTANREVIQRLAREVPEGADVVGTVLAWRDAARTTETLTTKVTDLEAKLAERDRADRQHQVTELVAAGLADGKLTPASRDALLKALADDTGNVDPARLKAYLDAAPRVVPTTATRSKEPTTGAGKAAAGKTEWETLTNTERHQLALTDRAEFDRILAEYRAARAA